MNIKKYFIKYTLFLIKNYIYLLEIVIYLYICKLFYHILKKLIISLFYELSDNRDINENSLIDINKNNDESVETLVYYLERYYYKNDNEIDSDDINESDIEKLVNEIKMNINEDIIKQFFDNYLILKKYDECKIIIEKIKEYIKKQKIDYIISDKFKDMSIEFVKFIVYNGFVILPNEEFLFLKLVEYIEENNVNNPGDLLKLVDRSKLQYNEDSKEIYEKYKSYIEFNNDLRIYKDYPDIGYYLLSILLKHSNNDGLIILDRKTDKELNIKKYINTSKIEKVLKYNDINMIIPLLLIIYNLHIKNIDYNILYQTTNKYYIVSYLLKLYKDDKMKNISIKCLVLFINTRDENEEYFKYLNNSNDNLLNDISIYCEKFDDKVDEVDLYKEIHHINVNGFYYPSSFSFNNIDVIFYRKNQEILLKPEGNFKGEFIGEFKQGNNIIKVNKNGEIKCVAINNATFKVKCINHEIKERKIKIYVMNDNIIRLLLMVMIFILSILVSSINNIYSYFTPAITMDISNNQFANINNYNTTMLNLSYCILI